MNYLDTIETAKQKLKSANELEALSELDYAVRGGSTAGEIIGRLGMLFNEWEKEHKQCFEKVKAEIENIRVFYKSYYRT